MVQPVVTVCLMCPNLPGFIRNGWLTSLTDFESELKIYTVVSWCPYKAYLNRRAGTSFIQDEICQIENNTWAHVVMEFLFECLAR